MKLCVAVADEFKCDFGMRKRHPFHQITDTASFTGSGFQKFFPGGCIIKQIMHQKRRSFRCADLFQILFRAALNDVADTGQASCCLCDHFHLTDGGNTGKRLAAETKCA